jgi:predicted Rossmann fold flavoprotein
MELWIELSGLSAEVVAEVELPGSRRGGAARRSGAGQAFREKMLITHRGLSGPAVLQISSYWKPGETVTFDLVPGKEVFTPMLEATARRDEWTMIGLLRHHLPIRMAEKWLYENPPADWKNASIQKLEERLHAWPVKPAGTEGYAKAEVTAGGVNTAELDSTTMQSKKVPGLAFIGEVVDVTGWLGGYNFQWAWASAFAAAAGL